MDELELQAQQELDAMSSGTNDATTAPEVEEVEPEIESNDDIEEETEPKEETDSSEEDWEPKSKKEKTEDRFKKVLSDKNSYKTKAEEALAKIDELQNNLADKDFYWERPQAQKFTDEIKSIREANPNLTREDAFNMIAGRENLSAKPKGLIGKPKAPEAVKGVKEMSDWELEQALTDAGGLEALI